MQIDFSTFSPFAIPVRTVKIFCRPVSPIAFHALPAMTMRGAFGYALAQVGCRDHQEGREPCPLDSKGAPLCSRPHECAYPILFKPHSRRQGKDFASPVIFRASHLADRYVYAPFYLEVALIGRVACDATAVICAAVDQIGQMGLDTGEGKVPFTIEEVQTEKIMPLKDWIEKMGPPPQDQCLIEFVSPFYLEVTVVDENNRKTRQVVTEMDVLPLDIILGNFAGWLPRWAIEDGNEFPGLEKRIFEDQVVEVIIDKVKADAAVVRVDRTSTALFDFGDRVSKASKKEFPQVGFTGHATLGGDLQDVWPWLCAMAFCHGGGKRPAGYGEIKLWR